MNIPEIKISFKVDKVKKSEMTQISTSKQGYDVLREVFNADTIDWLEEAIVLCLNNASKVVGFYKLSTGGVTGTVMDPRIIFTVALNCGASGIVIAHNHPSGTLKPSQNDIDITYKIREGGKLLNIKLLDHIIVTDEGYYSFGDDGKL
jgi:DNA repair protein RadC